LKSAEGERDARSKETNKHPPVERSIIKKNELETGQEGKRKGKRTKQEYHYPTSSRGGKLEIIPEWKGA